MSERQPALDNVSMETERPARLYTSVWSAGGVFYSWLTRRAIGAWGANPQTVLDVACGPGFLPIAFARKAPEADVSGLDVSSFMIKEARARVDSAGLADRVTIVEGSACEMPFPDGSFELVTMSNALHMFEDVPRLFEEIERVLQPGGLFFGQAFVRDAALPVRAFGWVNTKIFELMRSGLEGLGPVLSASLTVREVQAIVRQRPLLHGKVWRQWGYLLMMELRRGEEAESEARES